MRIILFLVSFLLMNSFATTAEKSVAGREEGVRFGGLDGNDLGPRGAAEASLEIKTGASSEAQVEAQSTIETEVGAECTMTSCTLQDSWAACPKDFPVNQGHTREKCFMGLTWQYRCCKYYATEESEKSVGDILKERSLSQSVTAMHYSPMILLNNFLAMVGILSVLYLIGTKVVKCTKADSYQTIGELNTEMA